MSARSRATTSSWVIARTMSRPLRSLNRVSSGSDRVEPAARAPDVGGVDDRHLHLLAADRVLLLADDLLDPVVDPLAERQQRVDPGTELADVARADEQAVRRHLGVGRIVAKGAEEELGETHPRRIAGAPPRDVSGGIGDERRPCRLPDAPAELEPPDRVGDAHRADRVRQVGRVGPCVASGAPDVRNASRPKEAASPRRSRIGASWARIRSTSRANAGTPHGPASRGWSRRMRRT